jgi:glycosyltransferase involved in cell wall biosynthesis
MISVVMPVYNGQKFLKQSIDSILNQTYENFELIIVNDGSTDNSEKIINSYSDPRIKYYKKENNGVASARTYAIKYAKGDFIVYQDDDDISIPNRFARLLKKFDNQEIGFVHSDMLLIDENNYPVGYWQSQQIDNSMLLRHFLIIGTPFNNASIMIRKNIISSYQYNNSLKIGEDTDIVSQISLNNKSTHIAEPLLLYRRHANNSSKTVDHESYALHVRKFINRHGLVSLFPELNWNYFKISKIRAKALLGLFLFRRGMTRDAQKWINQSIKEANKSENLFLIYFVSGIIKLVKGNFNAALNLFKSCESNYLIHNYIGESYAYLEEYDKAFNHFLEALLHKPNYIEPVINLKSIGSKNLSLINNSWKRFL